ncbi:MAG: Tsi3 family protein [Desulfobulbaceae bacterium]|nr:Tsi3 family protein [Desulfobulbaceae bacterium]
MRTFILVVAVSVIMFGCSSSNEALPKSWEGSERIVVSHSNGLILELPPAVYRIDETADGFLVQPVGAERMRNPFEIQVRLAGKSPPAGLWLHRCDLGERQAHYRTETHEGGSGGAGHVLQAWQSHGDVVLTLRQLVQVEGPNEPDFRDGWAIFAAARL